MSRPDTVLTLAFRMQLFPGQQQEYRRRHTAIWPELRAALLEAGVLDYRIFHDASDDALFALLHCREANTLAELPALPVMRRWWAYMADIMVTAPDLAPLQQPLSEMFVLKAEGEAPCAS